MGDGGEMGERAHLLVEEGRGTEEGARRGEKEGLAGAAIHRSMRGNFKLLFRRCYKDPERSEML